MGCYYNIERTSDNGDPIEVSAENVAEIGLTENDIVLIKGEKGDKGDPGENGADGQPGKQGADGLSAYQIAVDNGFTGTEAEWLASLKGEAGPQGPKGNTGSTGATGPKGDKGDKGDTGEQGPQGETGPAGTTDYNELQNKPTIPSATSDLTNDSGFITGMTILSYGHSTWQDFLDAYKANKVVYCRASTASDPAIGPHNRMAFMAYVNDANNPTNVEFQYYRSMKSHSATQQGDQVYVYTLDQTAGWTVIVRESYTKIAVGPGLSSSYSDGVLTISLA